MYVTIQIAYGQEVVLNAMNFLRETDDVAIPEQAAKITGNAQGLKSVNNEGGKSKRDTGEEGLEICFCTLLLTPPLVYSLDGIKLAFGPREICLWEIAIKGKK